VTARPQRNERIRERAVVELAGVNVLVGLISLRSGRARGRRTFRNGDLGRRGPWGSQVCLLSRSLIEAPRCTYAWRMAFKRASVRHRSQVAGRQSRWSQQAQTSITRSQVVHFSTAA